MRNKNTKGLPIKWNPYSQQGGKNPAHPKKKVSSKSTDPGMLKVLNATLIHAMRAQRFQTMWHCSKLGTSLNENGCDDLDLSTLIHQTLWFAMRTATTTRCRRYLTQQIEGWMTMLIANDPAYPNHEAILHSILDNQKNIIFITQDQLWYKHEHAVIIRILGFFYDHLPDHVHSERIKNLIKKNISPNDFLALNVTRGLGQLPMAAILDIWGTQHLLSKDQASGKNFFDKCINELPLLIYRHSLTYRSTITTTQRRFQQFRPLFEELFHFISQHTCQKSMVHAMIHKTFDHFKKYIQQPVPLYLRTAEQQAEAIMWMLQADITHNPATEIQKETEEVEGTTPPSARSILASHFHAWTHSPKKDLFLGVLKKQPALGTLHDYTHATDVLALKPIYQHPRRPCFAYFSWSHEKGTTTLQTPSQPAVRPDIIKWITHLLLCLARCHTHHKLAKLPPEIIDWILSGALDLKRYTMMSTIQDDGKIIIEENMSRERPSIQRLFDRPQKAMQAPVKMAHTLTQPDASEPTLQKTT